MIIPSKHLIISKKNKLAAVYNLKRIKEIHISPRNYQIGNIYIGIIETFLRNIEAVFIKLSFHDKNGFMHVPAYFNSEQEIPEKLTYKKKLLVQIIKEPTANKGPSLSTNIALIGSYMVFLPFEKSIKISKNITDIKEKIYLKGIINLLKPLKTGVLIKKEAATVNSNILRYDFYRLQKKWRRIKTLINEKTKCATCLLDNKSSFIQNTIKKLYLRLFKMRKTEAVLLSSNIILYFLFLYKI